MKRKTLLFIIISILITTNLLLVYFSNLSPYKKPLLYKYSNLYFDFFKEQQNQLISIFYNEESKLPTYKINISNINLKKLNSNLPISGQKNVNANIILPNNIKQKIEVKYRGDHYWHWKYDKKSWRVNLSTNYENEKILNFINPRHKSQILYSLGFYLGEKAKLLTPHSEFIKLFINDDYQGLYLKTEQVNEDFLTQRNLRTGDLFFGEPNNLADAFTTINGVFDNPNLWEIKNYTETNNINHLTELLNLINNDLTLEYPENLAKSLDISAILKYMAILDIANSSHIDNTHNFKLYFNPETNLFEPIVWDLFAWINLNTNNRVSSTTNSLFQNLLLYPQLAEEKNKYIFEYLQDFASSEKINDFINLQVNTIKDDLLFDPIKDYIDDTFPAPYFRRILSFSEWKKRISLVKTVIKDRNQFLINELNNTTINIYIQNNNKLNNTIYFDIIGHSPIQISKFNNQNLKSFKYNPIYNSENFIKEDIDLNNLKLSPGQKIQIIPIYYAIINTEHDTKFIDKSPLRYKIEITNISQDELLNNLKNSKMINSITNTQIIPKITIIKTTSELPQIDLSNSIHPWTIKQ